MLQTWMMAAKRFVNDMELEDIALFKVCLIAFGALMGLAVPKKLRKSAGLMASVVFLFTCAGVMVRFFASLTRRD